MFILLKLFEIWMKKLPSVKCNSPDFESSLSGSAFDAFESIELKTVRIIFPARIVREVKKL